jgi:hypothetical protein
MNLRETVRDVVAKLEKSGPGDARSLVEPLRAFVQPGVHVGTKPTGEAVVEWYAGQLLDIVDTEAWFAMNSILSNVDSWVPAEPGRHSATPNREDSER